MQSYLIHLIRHGVTEGNLRGRYIGSTDVPLAEEGKKRLLDLRAKGGYPTAKAYFSSPLLRCRQIAWNCSIPACRPIVLDGLRECNFGEWEGENGGTAGKGRPSFCRLDGKRRAGHTSRRGIGRGVHAPRVRDRLKSRWRA